MTRADRRRAFVRALENNVAHPGKIAIGGHSYGAFMTVNLLAHAPHLFSCGIACWFNPEGKGSYCRHPEIGLCCGWRSWVDCSMDYFVNLIEISLEMLAGVSLAEEGILTFVFAVVYLSLNKGGNDNDVSSASRLLSLGTHFSKKMICRYGSLQHIGRHTNVAAVFGQGGNKNLYNEKIAGEAKDRYVGPTYTLTCTTYAQTPHDTDNHHRTLETTTVDQQPPPADSNITTIHRF
ncbi:unnamed protein product [Lactuca saligna]|uniref:Peptidase S9 prolyl oligopeptidase catalytic domain-containing protein n=1 Tax=Lactuca saligna TaxID=75948 RepID=A0AA36EFR4_LACSI|nr:unnamed protein product [Lactuca saligna]